MRPGLLLLLLLLLGCRSREPRFPVERVVLTGDTVVDNAWLGVEPQQVESLFTDLLRQSGRFELSEGQPRQGSPAQGAWQLTLELPFTREVLKEGHSQAEVGASLVLERQEPEPQQYEVSGVGEVQVAGQEPAARRRAMREALRQALAQALESAVLQLADAGRSDEELVRRAELEDERVRDMALRTLAVRRHPASTSLLVAQLQDRDIQVVRRAMGALVEMKARSAVPALIDMTKGQDVGFQREIVFAIGEIGGPEAEAYLFTVAQGHDQPAVQDAAQRALDTLHASRKLGAAQRTVGGTGQTEEPQ
jgi:hypothetical protein